MVGRKFKEYPDAVRMETRFGAVLMKAVAEDAVFVETPRGEPICVRGVMYSLGGHVYADGRGGWTSQPDDRHRSTLSPRRTDFKEASHAADRAVREEMERVASEYAAGNVDAFREAALTNVSNDIMHVEKEIAAGETALRELYDRRRELLNCEQTIADEPTVGPRP